jgi:hypothetical protein
MKATLIQHGDGRGQWVIASSYEELEKRLEKFAHNLIEQGELFEYAMGLVSNAPYFD